MGGRAILAFAAAVAAALVCVPGAMAAFPGKPGLIVFSALQPGFDKDLFVLAPGREPVALTDTSMVRGSDPVYSPDGRTVAFTRDDGTGPEVWVMNADGSGTPHFLTDSGSASGNPAFSDDGRLIAYEHFTGGHNAIFVMNANGSDQHQLIPGDDDNRAPAFSPNGRFIVYSKLIPGEGSRLFVAPTDGGSEGTQRTDTENDDFEPAWLPDSRRLVFARGTPTDTARSVWIMNPNGGGQRPLTSEGGYRLAPTVAPDASRFLFLREEGPLDVLRSMPLRGGAETPLTDGVDVDAVPDWQPLPVRCGGRTATLVGTPGRDRLKGTAGRDVIAGLGGRDRIAGRGGRDILCGGGGRDRCVGGPGRDRVRSCERRRSI